MRDDLGGWRKRKGIHMTNHGETGSLLTERERVAKFRVNRMASSRQNVCTLALRSVGVDIWRGA